MSKKLSFHKRFKKLPAWKRGALIGATIGGILVIISILEFFIFQSGFNLGSILYLLFAPLYFLLVLIGFFIYSITGSRLNLFLILLDWFLAIILQIGIFAVIGALIGWIIGGIKFNLIKSSKKIGRKNE